MNELKQPRAMKGGKTSLYKMKRDPGLQLQEYLRETSSAEEALFMINELLHAGQHQELRKNMRAPIALPVVFRLGAATYKSSSYTLSQRGIFIKFPEPPPEGTEIEMEFVLPDEGGPIRTRGEVVQSAGLAEAMKRASISGMSVVFSGISREDRRRIDKMVRSYIKKVPKSLR